MEYDKLPPLPGIPEDNLCRVDVWAYAQAYALEAVRQERERIEASDVVQFLYGAGELDGVGYSEAPIGKPRYWWRSLLRAAIRG